MGGSASSGYHISCVMMNAMRKLELISFHSHWINWLIYQPSTHLLLREELCRSMRCVCGTRGRGSGQVTMSLSHGWAVGTSRVNALTSAMPGSSFHKKFDLLLGVAIPHFLILIYLSNSRCRLKMTFSCMMELFKYPLDVQVCTMEIASCEWGHGDQR